MESRQLKKIDYFVLIWGAILSSGSSFLWNKSIFLGVFIGAVLASINWVGFRFFMTRLMNDKTKKRVHYGIALAVKTLVIFVLVALIIVYVPVNKIAFVVGLSSLMLGIFTCSFVSVLSGKGDVAMEKDF